MSEIHDTATQLKERDKKTWNEAIEEAAKIAADYQSDKAAAKIRSLKK